jgi:hypothetical protein
MSTILECSIKKYSIEVTFNGMTSLLNFIKIYLLVQKLLRGHRRTDRQAGDLISLTFLFKESRLKMNKNSVSTCMVDMLTITCTIQFETEYQSLENVVVLPVHESKKVENHCIIGHGTCSFWYLLPAKTHSICTVKSTILPW